MSRTEIGQMLRRLARRPGFAAAAVLTLALGIGATVAIFTVVYGVLLRPFPYADAERLVGLWHTAPALGIDKLNQSYGSYTLYRERARTIEDAGLYDVTSFNVAGSGEPERLIAARATASVFSVRLALGAGRGRLARGLMAESVFLAALGGLAGVGLAAVGVRGLARLDPGTLPRLAEIRVDAPVLGFALLVSLFAGLAFGVLPSLRLRGRRLGAALAEGGRGAVGSIGIYGVLAHSVAQRTREIGVRLALGAGPGTVFGALVGQGLRLTGVGVVLGLAGAVVAGRVLGALLFGVKAADPLSLIAVVALLVLVAAAASFVPAQRAARIAPTEALRYE